ncbi:MAG: LysM peptidoglycan-binding domain-containing protein, partial [Candidatus Eremiobacterota bacterium]
MDSTSTMSPNKKRFAFLAPPDSQAVAAAADAIPDAGDLVPPTDEYRSEGPPPTDEDAPGYQPEEDAYQPSEEKYGQDGLGAKIGKAALKGGVAAGKAAVKGGFAAGKFAVRNGWKGVKFAGRKARQHPKAALVVVGATVGVGAAVAVAVSGGMGAAPANNWGAQPAPPPVTVIQEGGAQAAPAQTAVPGQTSLGQGERVHVVQPGETLFGIASQYGVPMDAIAARNGIANPNLIRANSTLIIPAPATPVAQVPVASPTPVQAAPDLNTTYGFEAALGPYAREMQQATGIPADVQLAIAYYRSGMDHQNVVAHNYFGLPADPDWVGPAPIDGRMAYNNPREAFLHFALNVTHNQAVQVSSDGAATLASMRDAGIVGQGEYVVILAIYQMYAA